jgi:2-haloacid dehalogenase
VRRPDLPIEAVVFDLGAVLIDWDARYLYRSLLPDDAAVDAFLAEVGFGEWNEALDAGEDWDDAVAGLSARHPDRADLIEAFRDRWEETVGEPIQPVVDVLRELVDARVRTFALSNWSRRTFDIARPRFPFLGWFEGVVISGDEGVTKPDPRIFRILLDRYRLDPRRTVFIDDRPRNIEAAEELGMTGIVLVDPATLRETLRGLGLPLAPSAA